MLSLQEHSTAGIPYILYIKKMPESALADSGECSSVPKGGE